MLNCIKFALFITFLAVSLVISKMTTDSRSLSFKKRKTIEDSYTTIYFDFLQSLPGCTDSSPSSKTSKVPIANNFKKTKTTQSEPSKSSFGEMRERVSEISPIIPAPEVDHQPVRKMPELPKEITVTAPDEASNVPIAIQWPKTIVLWSIYDVHNPYVDFY